MTDRFAPRIIGATGGSGTRVFAAVARHAGLFTGGKLNESEDSLPLAYFSDCWINRFVPMRSSRLPPDLQQPMQEHLGNALRQHLQGKPAGHPWGWKEPRSIFLLPFLERELPGLRSLHVVRDGRDIAFSENQNQLRKHGDALMDFRAGASDAVRSIQLWERVNLDAAAFGSLVLRERYRRLRFEDLCRRPRDVIEEILRFFELDGDPYEFVHLVAAPSSLGRWRIQPPGVLRELESAARTALAAFGYAPSEVRG